MRGIPFSNFASCEPLSQNFGSGHRTHDSIATQNDTDKASYVMHCTNSYYQSKVILKLYTMFYVDQLMLHSKLKINQITLNKIIKETHYFYFCTKTAKTSRIQKAIYLRQFCISIGAFF